MKRLMTCDVVGLPGEDEAAHDVRCAWIAGCGTCGHPMLWPGGFSELLVRVELQNVRFAKAMSFAPRSAASSRTSVQFPAFCRSRNCLSGWSCKTDWDCKGPVVLCPPEAELVGRSVQFPAFCRSRRCWCVSSWKRTGLQRSCPLPRGALVLRGFLRCFGVAGFGIMGGSSCEDQGAGWPWAGFLLSVWDLPSVFGRRVRHDPSSD
jgi:hypothetical protein